MKKEEEKSYGIAAGRDSSSGVVGPCPNGAPSHDVDASYRHRIGSLQATVWVIDMG